MFASLERLTRLRRVLTLVSAGIVVLLLTSCWFNVGVNDGTTAVQYRSAAVIVWRGTVNCPTAFMAGPSDFDITVVPVIHYNSTWSSYRVAVPLWPVLALSLFVMWRVRRRELVARGGACVACGYDRRGLGADAKCPECGAVPARG